MPQSRSACNRRPGASRRHPRTAQQPVKIVDIGYFSDILCVWAYVAQARVDELRRQLGERVRIEYQFINLFGSTETRIGAGWSGRR